MLDENDNRIMHNLVSFADLREPLWRTDEFPAIWNHQLECSMVQLVQEIDILSALEVQELCSAQLPVIHSLRDLFLRKHPPLRLLAITKTWAETMLQARARVAPTEIVSAIQDIAIILEREMLGQFKIPLPGMLQQRAKEWSMSSWIDQGMRNRISQLFDAQR